MRTQLWQLACLYWTTANLLAFALMGLDKRRARRGCWRISEKALFFFPVLLSVAVAGALICLEQAVPAVRTSCPLTTGKVHTCRTSRIFSHTCRRKSRFNSLCQKVLQGPFGSL